MDLGHDEKWDLRSARHWLTFDQIEDATPSAGEQVNLFLLALWLVKPTKTHAKMRFEINKNHEAQHIGQFTRLLTRFSWIEGHVRFTLGDADIARAARYFRSLREIAARNGRLYQALGLHATGCWASHWHVGFICHSAAIETLLTYSKKGPITRQLATSFACLTRRSKANRDAAFIRFRKLYNIRSDINHGRTYTVPAGLKLRSLAQLEMAVRQLWRIILSSPHARRALEGTDAQRQAFFTELESGYSLP